MDNAVRKLQITSEVGLKGGVFLIAGVMISSGIFMFLQTVWRNVRTPGSNLVIWACTELC